MAKPCKDAFLNSVDYEYDYQTEWLDCLYPHDNGETFELKIQFCVLKPKKPLVKKQKKE